MSNSDNAEVAPPQPAVTEAPDNAIPTPADPPNSQPAETPATAPSQPKPSTDEALKELTAKLVGPTEADIAKKAASVNDDDLVNDPTAGIPKDYLDQHAGARSRIEKLSGLSKRFRTENEDLKARLTAAEQDAQVFRLLEKAVPAALQAKQSGQALPPDVATLKPIYEAMHRLFAEATPAAPAPTAATAPAVPDLDAQIAKALDDYDVDTARRLLAQRAAAPSASVAPLASKPVADPIAQPPAPASAAAPAIDPTEMYWQAQAESAVAKDIGAKADLGAYFVQDLMPRIAKELEPALASYRARGMAVDPVSLFHALPAQEKHRLTMVAHQAVQASKAPSTPKAKPNMLGTSTVTQRPQQPSGNPFAAAVEELREFMG